jgi:HK97 family phage major capsid protein
MSRALTTTAFSTGAALVDTAVLGSEYIELLRNRTVVDKLGIRMLAGLTANVALPRAVGGGTTYWLSDDGTNVTTSNQTFGQVGITPHTLIANTAYSKQLMAQASLDVEGLVRNDLGRVLGIEKDRVVLLGKGTAGEPLGVSKLSGVGSVTFGAAATWAKLLDFETQVAAANALQGNMAFVISPATRAKFKNQPKVGSTFPNFLFDQNNDGSGDGYINGYYGIVTNQVGTASTVQNQVIYGNWNDLIMASFAGLDVVVDPFSLSKAAQIQITITQWMDVAVRHAGSFCISSDSGAQ